MKKVANPILCNCFQAVHIIRFSACRFLRVYDNRIYGISGEESSPSRKKFCSRREEERPGSILNQYKQ